jgi:hypothetical protein
MPYQSRNISDNCSPFYPFFPNAIIDLIDLVYRAIMLLKHL